MADESMTSGEREEMQRRILAEAASLFNRKGFSGATTRELAGSLGLQRSSLYHYLESKHDLLYAICVASMQAAMRSFTAAVDAATPETRLRSAICAYMVTMAKEQDMQAVMRTEFRSLAPERRSEIMKLRAEYENQWRELLRGEQEAGRLRADIDSRFLQLALFSFTYWPIFFYRPSGPVEPEELGDMIADLFLDGTWRRAAP